MKIMHLFRKMLVSRSSIDWLVSVSVGKLWIETLFLVHLPRISLLKLTFSTNSLQNEEADLSNNFT